MENAVMLFNPQSEIRIPHSEISRPLPQAVLTCDLKLK